VNNNRFALAVDCCSSSSALQALVVSLILDIQCVVGHSDGTPGDGRDPPQDDTSVSIELDTGNSSATAGTESDYSN
jgi:hypothetical protein